MADDRRVVVLACSGVGKSLGLVAREAVYELVDRLRPGVAVTTCLPLLVIEDPEAVRLVREHPVVTLDGCVKDCARKSVEALGLPVARALRTLDFQKEHKDLRPEGLVDLNEAGQRLAVLGAERLAAEVDRLVAGR
jgi:uncharacterized metal-binding protein